MHKFLVSFFLIVASIGCSAKSLPSALQPGETIDHVVIPAQPQLNDVTIIVSSCDKYSEFWEPFGVLLFRYWPSLKTYNKHVPILFIANKKPFAFPGIQTIQTGEDGGWSRNMLKALAQVKTKYVLYLQEDYFLSEPVNEKYLYYLIQKMKELDIAYVEVNNGGSYKEKYPYAPVRGTDIKGKHTEFRASLQASLWNKDIFEWLIKPQENAWDFEANASIRSEGLRNPFLVTTPGYYPLTFINACHVGFWNIHAINFLKNQHIPVQVGMPVDTDYKFTLWLMDNHRKIYKQWIKLLRLFDPKLRKK